MVEIKDGIVNEEDFQFEEMLKFMDIKGSKCKP